MEVFPHLTLPLLLYTLILHIPFLWYPAPYGKFSVEPFKKIPSTSNTLFHFLRCVGFVTFLIGYFDKDWNYKHDWPSHSRAWALILFLCIYFLWRSLLFPLAYNYFNKNLPGEKRVTVLLPLLYIIFYGTAGFILRAMLMRIDTELKDYEYVLLFAMLLAFCGNTLVDITMNMRRDEGTRYSVGWYLSETQIFNMFQVLRGAYNYMFLPPNYALEAIMWFFFLFITFDWAAVWFVACIMIFLIVRGFGQRNFYITEAETSQTLL